MGDRLAFCIDHMEVGIGLYVLCEGLTKRADSEPADASNVLQHVVERWSTSPELACSEGKLEEVVDALCTVAGEREEEIIKQIVVTLHRDAGIDFREKLADADRSSA